MRIARDAPVHKRKKQKKEKNARKGITYMRNIRRASKRYNIGGGTCCRLAASIILNVPFFGGIFIRARTIDREKTGAYAI